MRHALLTILCLAALAGCEKPVTGSQPAADSQKGNAMSDAKTTGEFEVNKTEEEWKKTLTPTQYYVLREKGTERPFTGQYTMTREKGVYHCAACGAELFSSDAKFDSHCGWPSFTQALKNGTVKEQPDTSHGMVRTEVLCARCGSHLGHVFDDGPGPTGLRYCINSVSLILDKDKQPATAPTTRPAGK